MQSACGITNIVMEKLHCAICSGFLSCGPVRVLPDGSCICGRCLPPSNVSTVYRVHVLEALLENVSFPCCFANHGCAEHLLFGQIMKHELTCGYRSFACPSQRTACCWEGFTSQILNHFAEAHPEQLLQKADLKFEVHQNAEGVIVVLKESIVFLVKYQYDAKNTQFTYDIRFCKSDSVCAASYRLQLINNSDPEYTISLKTVDCSVYDNNFGSSQREHKLNLDKFLQCLNHPTSVLISISINSRKRRVDRKCRVPYPSDIYY